MQSPLEYRHQRGVQRGDGDRAVVVGAGGTAHAAAEGAQAVAVSARLEKELGELEDDEAAAGDEVVLFGPGTAGEPTADDWADAARTINYEIVTRLGARIPRRYVDSER